MRCKGVLLLNAGLLLGAVASAAEAPPVDVIKNLNASLEDVLRHAQELGYEGRLERLRPVIEGTFDLDFMARTAVGRHWKDLDEKEQQQWLAAFKHLTCANYAGRFKEYTGQRFELLGSEPASNESVLVRTRIVVPGEESVEVSYRLRDTGETWKVIDLYLKGTVSELALRRSEYASVLKREGFESLLAAVDHKVAEFRAEGEAAKGTEVGGN